MLCAFLQVLSALTFYVYDPFILVTTKYFTCLPCLRIYYIKSILMYFLTSYLHLELIKGQKTHKKFALVTAWAKICCL